VAKAFRGLADFLVLGVASNTSLDSHLLYSQILLNVLGHFAASGSEATERTLAATALLAQKVV
jgi:hypothetical protein